MKVSVKNIGPSRFCLTLFENSFSACQFEKYWSQINTFSLSLPQLTFMLYMPFWFLVTIYIKIYIGEDTAILPGQQSAQLETSKRLFPNHAYIFFFQTEQPFLWKRYCLDYFSSCLCLKKLKIIMVTSTRSKSHSFLARNFTFTFFLFSSFYSTYNKVIASY